MSILDRMLDRATGRPLSIEPMHARHIGQVMTIEQQSYPRPWTAQVFHDELYEARAGRRHYLVARRANQVVGYAGLMFVSPHPGLEAHITNVAVDPHAQRQGIARGLLVGLADAAIAHGCPSWTLEVRSTSTGAQELYRSFGFAPTGVRRNYYEQSIDAIVMWCHDIDSAAYAERLRELSDA